MFDQLTRGLPPDYYIIEYDPDAGVYHDGDEEDGKIALYKGNPYGPEAIEFLGNLDDLDAIITLAWAHHLDPNTDFEDA